MASPADRGPMRIRLDDERRERIVHRLRQLVRERFDEDLSAFRAEALVDFFVKELGAPVYNQAIRDAHGYFGERLADLEGEFYEPESEG